MRGAAGVRTHVRPKPDEARALRRPCGRVEGRGCPAPVVRAVTRLQDDLLAESRLLLKMHDELIHVRPVVRDVRE